MNKMLSTVALLAIAGNVLMAGGDIAPVEPIVPEVVVSDSWKFASTFYVFAAAIGGETSNGTEIDVSFRDMVEDLDMTYMGGLDVKKGKWNLHLDLIYLKVGNKSVTETPGPTLTKFPLKAWIVSPHVGYNVMKSEQWNVYLFTGARAIRLEPTVGLNDDIEVSTSDTAWDGLVGVKGTYSLDDKWFIAYLADVGTGDTDMSWQTFAALGYRYENFDVIAGYRYMDVEIDEGGTFSEALNSLDLTGPMIGINYRF